MGQTAIISPQIIDSTATGRDLITAVDAAAGRTVLEIEDASYNWTGDHVFEGSIEATNYAFTAGTDGQLSHPDLGNSIYVRFNNADVYRFNALDFWPVSTGTKNLGRSDHEWANVYSVAGAFSGTVTANAFVGDGSGLTNLPGGNPFDQDLNTTDSPSFVDGSFSGNLNTEVGGSQRVYNLGTEGDADTEYLEASWDANDCEILTKNTGAGVQRELRLGNDGGYQMFMGSAAQGAGLAYNGGTKIGWSTTAFFPFGSNMKLGLTGSRWKNVYSVGGDFSGDVIMAANVDFTGLPTADPVVAGRLWNDSGTLKISAG